MNGAIKPDEALIEEFNAFKTNKTDKALILAINNSKLEISFKGDKDFDFNSLSDHLPRDQPRFVIYDFEYETREVPPGKFRKIICIYWCPITASARNRFTYSDSLSGLTALGGIQKQFQVDDYSGLEYDIIRNQFPE
jgi:cofilin